MRFLDVALKDLLQILRDWKAAAFLVAAPILFTLLMGFMMGGWSTSGPEDTRLPVGLLDRDGGVLGGQFTALIEQSGSLRVVQLTEADAAGLEAKVTKGKLAAAVILPAGYSANILGGIETPVDIFADSASATGSAAQRELEGMVTRLMGSVESARLAADAYDVEHPFAQATDREAFVADAIASAVKAWQNPPVTMQIVAGKTAAQNQPAVPSGFAQASPGNMITFALAGLIGAAEIIVVERKSGTLDRLLTTSIPRLSVLAGHYLAMCALVFVQVIILGIVGQLAFGLGYLHALGAFLIMATTIALWVGSMGLLIGVIARSTDQVAMLAIAPMLVLAGLGGAWMPLEVTGPAFQAVGRLTPTAWAMQGMQNLILRGQGLEGVLQPAGVLLVFAVVFAGLAVWRFEAE